MRQRLRSVIARACASSSRSIGKRCASTARTIASTVAICGVEVVTEEQEVRTGRQRFDASIGAAIRRGLHLQTVGDEHAAKAKFFAQKLREMRCENVAGRCASSAVTITCALMIAGALAATSANGSRSRACSVEAATSIRGSASWESTAVAPCPGKCL